MARRVFFSFHYQNDVWRVNQIRNLDQIVGVAAAGFADASLWEESKKKGDAVIQKMIDDGLNNTSVTVVCIGSQTAGRKFINYEISQSIARGNAIMGLQIHHLKNSKGVTDVVGATPAKLISAGAKIYKYVDHAGLKATIEAVAKAAGK
jgi:hypothetical protein